MSLASAIDSGAFSGGSRSSLPVSVEVSVTFGRFYPFSTLAWHSHLYLLHFCARNLQSQRDICHVLLDIASGLAYLHGHGIIHGGK
jgi:serine/threonine protein kinase